MVNPLLQQTPRRYWRLVEYTVVGVNNNGRIGLGDGSDKILLGTLTTSTANWSSYGGYVSIFARTPLPSSPPQREVYTPFERTDVVMTWGNAQGCFTCIKDVQAKTFSQMSIIEMNDAMRRLFHVGLDVRVDFPYASMTATLEFDEDEEDISLKIFFMVDHPVSFKMRARKSVRAIWE